MLTIKEISSKKEIMQFIKFPWEVYKNDPNWVPPLIFDTQNMLDKNKFPFFEFGSAAYFMAFRDRRPVGRITAHINRRHNEMHKTKDGFFGFYECLQDAEASRLLMKTAEDWVRGQGMNKIIGPENFTIYDELGFMIKGWDAEPATPVIMETYTPRYYLEQMEKAGYKKEIDWTAFLVKKDFVIKETLLKVKDRLVKRKGYTFRTINMKKLDEEIQKIKIIVNTAWQENWGHYQYTDRQFDHIAEALKMIVDPRVCFIVEDGEKPIACSISLPDINPTVKKINGRMLPFGIFHLLNAKKHAQGLRTFLMGVVQEYRNTGIDIALVVDTFSEGRKAGYQWAECSLVVETNKKMIDLLVKWGGDPYKVYRLFSKKV
jgi:hypothetical protein